VGEANVCGKEISGTYESHEERAEEITGTEDGGDYVEK
jgi:hypothetical protein